MPLLLNKPHSRVPEEFTALSTAFLAFPGMTTEPLYAYTVRLTRMTDFGIAPSDAFAGLQAIPPAGLRADIAFAGESTGRLAGAIEGVDYLNLRADGRMELDIRAVLTTPDGARIALHARGAGQNDPANGRILLREHVQMTTAHPAYSWLNPLEIWATGEADMAAGTVTVRGFIVKTDA